MQTPSAFNVYNAGMVDVTASKLFAGFKHLQKFAHS